MELASKYFHRVIRTGLREDLTLGSGGINVYVGWQLWYLPVIAFLNSIELNVLSLHSQKQKNKRKLK